MEHETEKSFLPEPEADESGEDSSDDESEPETDQDGQSGAHQEVPAAIRNCKTRLPAPLNPSRRVAREAYAILPLSRLRCARWTSIIYHRSRSRSAKHKRPRNGQIGNVLGKAKWTGNSRVRYGR